MTATRAIVIAVCALSAALASGGPPAPSPPPPALPVWIDGTSETEPAIQTHRYDDDTFILRQSLRTNFEGPFLYLLFGADRALLLDSGAGGIPLRKTIDDIIEKRRREKGMASLPLVVAHTHAHEDHTAGDAELRERPETTVVGPSVASVKEFFRIRGWPDQIVSFDLGGRVLDIVPAPGHEPSHIVVFDRRTHVLFTGDTLYPGRLYFPTAAFETYRSSVERILGFTRTRPVARILGAHIEMSDAPGKDYAPKATAHPGERRLELEQAHLLELHRALSEMTTPPKRVIRDSFILFPL